MRRAANMTRAGARTFMSASVCEPANGRTRMSTLLSCSTSGTDGGAAKSSARSGMCIATRAARFAKLRRSDMSLRTLGCRWAVRAKTPTYAAPTELDRPSGAVVAINMPLLTELAGPPMAVPHDSANDNSAKHDSVLP